MTLTLEQVELDLARQEWQAEFPTEPPEADITLSRDLYIYSVSQSEVRGYDTFDSFVCIAASEEDARDTDPRSIWEGSTAMMNWDDPDDPLGSWARSRSSVCVRLLGVALSDSKPGIVCASYNAG